MSDIKAFLREFNQYWADEDIAAILAAVTDGIRFSMGNGKTVVGKPELEGFLNEMTGHATDITLEIDNILVEGDRAAVNGRMEMTEKDGDRKTYAFCDMYHLAGGKVAALTGYFMEVVPEV